MSATYEVHDGCTTLISDAGRDKCEAEQRHARAEILMWTTVASIVTIAGLVLDRLMGA
ncbi:hypothetical protein J2801_003623 [Paraburkholderia phenoliruptrix]|uniref:hypothetical protein n=1 Tax=Paraburkholderia phenoliruptrix TaxID=252970 RepID=UPI00285C53AF|nr:hypothetical protein [Paraburkholderia phenoliruptrix]MDR6421335.1 hypothetical protein [Paraburkholderia phenoliruptrix]